ncbi:MAG: hypothetical protein M0Z50_06665 [Planctomycetia bacterium]|nr:hypothetical protein [Planctomycetia bacterium]
MLHPEPVVVSHPVGQAVARYQAAVTQISAGAAVIAARIRADDQASGTKSARPSTGCALAHPPGPFASAAKGAKISKIRP